SHLERLEAAAGWDAICTADRDPSRAKPAPTLYLEALSALEVAASEAVAFEDSPNGVRAAKAAGIFCVAVPNEVTRDLGLDEAGADIVLDSLADLPPENLLSRLEEGYGRSMVAYEKAHIDEIASSQWPHWIPV